MEGDGGYYLISIVVPAERRDPPPAFETKRTMTQNPSNKKRHGVALSAIALTLGVPAFAGTTSSFVSAAR
jgi:hypothetical protein